jgi:hypothetical protein
MDPISKLLRHEARRLWTAKKGKWRLLWVAGMIVLAAVVWLTEGVAVNRLINAVDTQVSQWAALPLGQAAARLVCALLAWTAVWIAVVLLALGIGALIGTWPRKRLKNAEEERKALEDKVRLIGAERDRLGVERDRLEVEKEGLVQLEQYGRAWIQVHPISDEWGRKLLNQAASGVGHKLDEAVKWGGKVWGDLCKATYTPLEDTAAAMIGNRINQDEYIYLKNALSAMHYSLGRDPRAPLVCAYVIYQEWKTQVLRFAESFKKPVQDFPDYHKWHEADTKLKDTLRDRANDTVELSEVIAALEVYHNENKPEPLPPTT